MASSSLSLSLSLGISLGSMGWYVKGAEVKQNSLTSTRTMLLIECVGSADI